MTHKSVHQYKVPDKCHSTECIQASSNPMNFLGLNSMLWSSNTLSSRRTKIAMRMQSFRTCLSMCPVQVLWTWISCGTQVPVSVPTSNPARGPTSDAENLTSSTEPSWNLNR
jgi:hypothetical protein